MATIAQLVVEVAANTAQLVTGVEQVHKKLDSLGGIADKVGGMLTGAFVVGTITAFAGELLEMGDTIVRVADQTGLLTDEVQKLQYIGGQTGNSIGDLTTAIGAMQKRLDDPAFVQALGRIKVNFDELQAAGPYEQLLLIAEGYKNIKNPAEQAQVAADLFSKSGITILPTLKADMRALGDEAPVLSGNMVKALDSIGDAWTRLKGQFAVGIVEMLVAPFQEAFSDKELQRANRWFSAVGLDTRAASADLRELGGWFDALRGKVEALPKVAPGFSFPKMEMPKSFTTAEIEAEIVSLDRYKETLKETAAAADKLATLQAHLFGQDVIAKAAEYVKALGGIEGLSKLTRAGQAELNTVMGAAYEVLVRAGQGASAAAAEYLKLRDATVDFVAIGKTLSAMPDPFAAQTKARSDAFRATQMAIMDQNQGISDSAQYWMHAGEIADASMAQAAAAVATVGAAATDTASRVREEFVTSFQSVGNEAASMAQRVAAVMNLMETNKKNMGMFGPNFGTADSINRMASRNAGLTLPGFANGGEGDFGSGTPVMLHGRERIIPLDKPGAGGGVVIHAPISISAGGGPGAAAQAGREAADALIARMRQAGVKV